MTLCSNHLVTNETLCIFFHPAGHGPAIVLCTLSIIYSSTQDCRIAALSIHVFTIGLWRLTCQFLLGIIMVKPNLVFGAVKVLVLWLVQIKLVLQNDTWNPGYHDQVAGEEQPFSSCGSESDLFRCVRHRCRRRQSGWNLVIQSKSYFCKADDSCSFCIPLT